MIERTKVSDLRVGQTIRASEYSEAYEVIEVKDQGGDGPVFVKAVGDADMICTFFYRNASFLVVEPRS